MATRGNQLVEDWGIGSESGVSAVGSDSALLYQLGNFDGFNPGGSLGGFNPCSSIASKRRTSVRYCSAGVIILFTHNGDYSLEKIQRKKIWGST